MKHFILSLAAILILALPARAQIRQDIATAVPVSIQGQGGGSVTFDASMVDMNGTLQEDYETSGSFSIGPMLKPGVVYTLQVATTSAPFQAAIFLPAGYTSYVGPCHTGTVSSSDPSQYYDEEDTWVDGQFMSVYEYYIVIEPTSSQTSLAAGASTSFHANKVYWSLGLGNMSGGRSEGKLVLSDNGTESSWANLYLPIGLVYQADTAYNSYGYMTPNSDGSIQLVGTQCVVDIEPVSSTSYTIDFYTPSQASWGTYGGVYKMGFSGTQYVRYEVEKGSGTNDIVIVKTVYSGSSAVQSATTELVRSGSAWTLTDWHESSSGAVSVTTWSESTGTVGGLATRTDTITCKDGAGNTAEISQKTYTTYAWGEELTQDIKDYGGSGLTTNYTYSTTPYLENYGQVMAVQYPDGRWKAYTYTQYYSTPYYIWGDILVTPGLISASYAPWENSPGSIPGSLSTTTGDDTTYTYDTSPTSPYFTQPTGYTRYVNNQVVGGQSISYSSTSLNSVDVTIASQVDSTTTSTSLTTTTKYYTADEFESCLSGKSVSVQRPDGTKDSYCYEFGTWSGSAFTVVGGDFNLNSVATRFTVYHGTTSSSGNTSFSGESGSPAVDTLYLVSNKSTKEVTIQDMYGRTAETDTYVWYGSTWNLISSTSYTYDNNGHLTGKAHSDGTAYSAGYTGDFKSSEATEDGQSYTYGADEGFRVENSTQAAGTGFYPLVISCIYDGAGHKTSESRASSSGLTFETIFTTFAYDYAGRVTSKTVLGLSAETYSYSSGGQVVTTTFPNGGTKVETMYDDGQVASITGTGVVPVYYTYSAQSDGQIETVAGDAASSPTRYVATYKDMLGRTTKTVKPAFGGGTTYVEQASYNSSTGQLASTARKNGSGTQLTANTLYQYDDMGQLSRSGLDVDNNGSLDLTGTDRITDTSSDIESSGSTWWAKTTTIVYPTASSGTPLTTQLVQRQLNNFSSGINADEQTYDMYGTLTETTTAINGTAHSVVQTTSNPGFANHKIVTMIDGLTTGIQDFDGLTTTTGYDLLWRPSTRTDPRGNTTSTSHVSGTVEPYTVTDAASNVIATYAYDGAGRVTSVKNANGKYTYKSYDYLNHVVHKWGDVPFPAAYSYDSYGARSTMSTYRGGSGWTGSSWPSSPGTADTTTWSYDSSTGLVTGKADAASHGPGYSYNTLGQIYQRTLARSVTSTYAYDSNTAELTGITYSDSTPSVSYAYTRAGRLYTVADASGTRDFVYDGTYGLQMDAEALDSTFYAGRILTRLYDNTSGYDTGSPDYGSYYAGWINGRPQGFELGVTGSLGRDLYQQYTLNDGGQFVGVHVYNGSSSARDFLYSYASGSELVNGYTLPGTNLAVSATFETHRDLPNQQKTVWSSTTLAQYDYVNNNLRQRQSTVEQGSAVSTASYQSMTYDDRGELTASSGYTGTTVGSGSAYSAHNFAYGFDTIGNRSSSNYQGSSSTTDSYTVNGVNQYSVFDPYSGSQTLSYDNDGNLTQDPSWDYSYDGENRLTSMASRVSGPTLTFTYDYLGRRVEKKVVSGGTTTLDHKYIYDGWNMIAEVDNSTGNILRSYTWGLDVTGTLTGAGGTGGLLQVSNFTYSGGSISGTADYFAAHDGNGNLTALVDSSGGLAQAYEYSPFGETITWNNAQSGIQGNPFGFADKYTDSETGLVYYGNRYYSPALGRFVNRDPVEEAGGINLYGFCGNDSINGADVLGCYPASYGANYTPPADIRPPMPGGGAGGPMGPNFNAGQSYSPLSSTQNVMAIAQLDSQLMWIGGIDSMAIMSGLQNGSITPAQASEYLNYNQDAGDGMPASTIISALQAGPGVLGSMIDVMGQMNNVDSAIRTANAWVAANTSSSGLDAGPIYMLPTLHVSGSSVDSVNQAEVSTYGSGTLDLSGLYSSANLGVVAVTLPGGMQYIPITQIKNQMQAGSLGAPVGAFSPIVVPPGVNPQSMIDDWGAGSLSNNLFSFATTWRQGGPNDYKRFGAIYDSYGNFEYGATGTTFGLSPSQLQDAAALTKTQLQQVPSYTPGVNIAVTYVQNSPENMQAIDAGVTAVYNGGQVSAVKLK